MAIKEEKQKLAASNQKFISRERKKELREQVLLKLRERFLPVPAEFNVIWDLGKGIVWFASIQGKMIDLFMEYFLITFELHLEPLTPYNLACALLEDADLSALDSLDPTQFIISAGNDNER